MHSILESTKYVVERAEDVRINSTAIVKTASMLSKIQPRHWLEEAPYYAHTLDVEQKLRLLFVFDAISFSYWGTPKWTIDYNGGKYDGSWAMLLCIVRAEQEGKAILDPRHLAELDMQEFLDITRGNTEIPLATERLDHLRQIGSTLIKRYDGKVSNLIRTSQRTAGGLLQQIAKLPCFHDTARYDCREVIFYKRAQVLTADIAHVLSSDDDLRIRGTERLTACADYKLPQMLRAYGILHYSNELARKIDTLEELRQGSREETEIRACTVWAIEHLTRAIREHRPTIRAIDVNDMLWLQSQDKTRSLKPYHRTRTTAY